MNTFVRVLAATAFCCYFALPAAAQCGCGDRIVYRLVYDEEEVTRYRVEYKTEYQEREYTVKRPVWTTETKTRKVRVAKPITETNDKVVRHTVLKPVWNTRWEERTVEKTEYVEETSSRTQRRTVMKPVDRVEERTERIRRMRPIRETVMEPYQVTRLEPHTTYRTDYVDQGGYVDRNIVHPDTYRNRLGWAGGGYGVDGRTGQSVYYRPGFHWIPQRIPGRVETRREYVPNVVGVERPVTTLRPETYQAERAVEVTRMEPYEEVRKYPVTVREWKEEIEETEVPTTVRKPIIRRITYRIPIRTKTWKKEVVERTVPVTTRKYVYEERDEPYEVRVCTMKEEVRRESVPVTVRKLVPYKVIRRVPRRVAVREWADSPSSSRVVVERASTDPADIPGAEIVSEEVVGASTKLGSTNQAGKSGEKADEKPTLTDEERQKLELKKPENAEGGNNEPTPAKGGESAPPTKSSETPERAKLKFAGWKSLWDEK